MNRPTILSIVSLPYSGSTLLTYLLAAHPAVGTIGERKKFHEKVIRPREGGSPYCSCGERFKECAFWLQVRSYVLASDGAFRARLNFPRFQFSAQPLIDRAADRIYSLLIAREAEQRAPAAMKARLARLLRANEALIEAVLMLSGTSVFVDASKSIRHSAYLDTSHKLDVRIIHLIRDGRGHVQSSLKRSPQLTMETASRNWASLNVRHRAGLETRSWPIMTVHYEQLCSDPDEMVSEICRFADIDPDRTSLRFRQVEQHIMGNWQMRSGSSEEIRDQQEWRRRLSRDQLRIFDQAAGEINRDLGYE